MKFIIGSRGSKLALWQANWVRDQLVAAGYEIEIRIIKTTGDKLQAFAPGDAMPASMAKTVAEAGTKGLFIKEIEEALLASEIDVAVHSLKDLPTVQPEGLILGAVPEREDARDVLIARGNTPLDALPSGARIATSSLRRQSQLRALRNDLTYLAIRGNLDTRLRKLERGNADALVLAAAGVHRLGLRDQHITSYFTLSRCAQQWARVRSESKFARTMPRRELPCRTSTTKPHTMPSGLSAPRLGAWVAVARCRSAPTRPSKTGNWRCKPLWPPSMEPG